jgi:hypothetical protein
MFNMVVKCSESQLMISVDTRLGPFVNMYISPYEHKQTYRSFNGFVWCPASLLATP